MENNQMHHLRENVRILSSLGSRSSVQQSQSNSRALLTRKERIWCRVLDEMAWLGDYRPGGKTVTSIAAQAKEEKHIYWLANNQGPKLPVQRHLQWVLIQLQSCTINDKENVNKTQQTLFKKSVVFSRRRVEFYYAQLRDRLTCVRADLKGPSDLLLLAYLEELIALREDHEALCLLAFQFRNNGLRARIDHHMSSSRIAPVWTGIRHYLGRLGSWWSACTALVAAAQAEPRIFLHSQIRVVADGMRWEDMTRTPGAKNTACQPAFKDHKTYIHAELLVLNHFYRRQLAFADDVAYIGCSKLSCYCCHTYMNLHPLTILPRPCHGNTWARWAMPALSPRKSYGVSSQDDHLLRGMVQHTQHEIESDLGSGAVKRDLESTTGLS